MMYCTVYTVHTLRLYIAREYYKYMSVSVCVNIFILRDKRRMKKLAADKTNTNNKSIFGANNVIVVF